MLKKNFVVDIDGTLCDTIFGVSYEDRPPIQEMIDKVNELYYNGSRIILLTARGMRTYSGNIDEINLHVRPVLEAWLNKNGVKYHELVMGKPWLENVYYVDDRAMLLSEFLKQ